MTRDEIIKELNDIGGDSEKWSRDDAIWLVEVSGEIIAALKAEVAKTQRKAEILEKIVEAAIEIPEPVVCDEIWGCECGLCDPAGPVVNVQREFVHAAGCPWGRIQDLNLEPPKLTGQIVA